MLSVRSVDFCDKDVVVPTPRNAHTPTKNSKTSCKAPNQSGGQNGLFTYELLNTESRMYTNCRPIRDEFRIQHLNDVTQWTNQK